MDTPKASDGRPDNKTRKRGRPPIDDYDQSFMAPKIMNVAGNVDDGYSNDALSSSEHDMSIWEEEHNANDGHNTEPEEQLQLPPQQQQQQQQRQQPSIRVKKELQEESNVSR